MKKFYAILCLAIASLTQLQAQAPQGFNYQATVRNSSGDLIVNTNVYFKFNVMQGSQTSLPVFTEIHYVPTDDLGQVNLVIGQGTANTGVFSELDWSLGSYYLGIELDTGSGYVAMGTTQLLSVPYALYAENSGNSTPTTPNLESVLAENNSAGQQQIKNLLDPTEAQDAVTKAYLDTQVESSQQDIEQVLTQGNDANGIQLKGIADPTDAQDAVTKAYLENNTTSSGLAPGSTVGDMLYWDGANWAQIPSPENNATLKFCDGQLTWGGCRPNILIHECILPVGCEYQRILYDLYPNGSIVSSIEILLSETNNLPDENDLVQLVWPQEWSEYTYNLTDEISICDKPIGTYYVRAKVESNLGTSYSETIQVVIDQNNSCSPSPINSTIVDIAVATPDLSNLVAALQAADGDLVTTLSGGEFTVLAPTNAAFETFLSENGFASLGDVPTDVLANILLNHVIAGSVSSTDLVTLGAGYSTTNATNADGDNLSLYFNTSDGVVFNGISSVTVADVTASNGIIHIVDEVIGLPTIATFATSNDAFSTLVDALVYADTGSPTIPWIDTVSDLSAGPFTLFAPSNDAFIELYTELNISGIYQINTTTIDAVLLTHVVSGNIQSSVLPSGTVTTLGGDITFSLTPSPQITDPNERVSNIVAVDVQAVNGVIHAIDKVILPQF